MTGDTTGTLTDLATTDGTGRAVIIGAGIGGLLAARALADHVERVIVLDRDSLSDIPQQRRNIPQGNHVHALLARGRTIVERLFPGIGDALVRDGAIRADSKRDLIWFQQGGYHAAPKRGQTVLMQSRPLLEHHLRQRVAALPNVSILDGCEVTGLLATRDRRRVTGVRVAAVADWGVEHEVMAALTVDASGRGSRLPAWLEGLGHEAPGQVSAGVEARYATRLFRRVPGQVTVPAATVIVASPQMRRGGVMMAQEGDRWIVSLSSRDGSQPPTELGGFIAWARSLEAPDIFEVVRGAEPLDDGTIYRFPRSTRRHYERLARFPAGLLPFGDAICAFNPVYAQGMSVAAIEAEHLSRCLADGDEDLARRFFAGIAPPLETAWAMAASGDLRYAGGSMELPRRARLAHAYMARLLDAAQCDAVVAEAFQRVSHLVDPPQALRRPEIAIRVAFASRRAIATPAVRIEPQEVATSRAA